MRFEDKRERAKMFTEFVACEMNLNAMRIAMTRKHRSQTRGRAKMIAKTEQEIMSRWNDRDYVDKVIAVAKREGRVYKDKIAPNDSSKTTYLVPWEVSLTHDKYQIEDIIMEVYGWANIMMPHGWLGCLLCRSFWPEF